MLLLGGSSSYQLFVNEDTVGREFRMIPPSDKHYYAYVEVAFS